MRTTTTTTEISLPPVDKIKRAITWIRKSLEITEKTTNPGTVSGEIIPTIDALGWEKLQELTDADTIGATNVTAVDSLAVPEGVLRYVLFASVEHAELAGTDLTCWMELNATVPSQTNFPCSIIRPQLLLGTAALENIRLGIVTPFILRPGERLRGRASPSTGVGVQLRIRLVWIDLPIGEYIAAF